MSVAQLARLLDSKYRLVSSAAPSAQVVLDAKKALRDGYAMWIESDKGSALREWAREISGEMKKFISQMWLLSNPQDMSNNDGWILFNRVQKALEYLMIAEDNLDDTRIALQQRKGLEKRQIGKLIAKMTDLRTIFRYLKSILNKQFEALKKKSDLVPFGELEESPSPYKKQKPTMLAPDKITSFLARYPVDKQYGLTKDNITKLLYPGVRLQNPANKVLLESLIRSILHGNPNPVEGQEILKKIKKIVDEEAVLNTQKLGEVSVHHIRRDGTSVLLDQLLRGYFYENL